MTAARARRTSATHALHAETHGPDKKQFALRTDMRQLWEDHVTWTRLAIISLETGTPDTKPPSRGCSRTRPTSATRSSRTTARPPATRSPGSCGQHILIAADVIAAAKAGDQAKLADAQARWRSNADEIAALLNSVNPQLLEARRR